MYSGSTLTPVSGRVIGAHQKIDRLAFSCLRTLLPKDTFPHIATILHFEGFNGPDAIKRKSPARDEPWHYVSPFDHADNQLIELIAKHYRQLVVALKAKDEVRAGFEAAWLAHAIVDGLTPAHHFPYEEKLLELRGGQSRESRTTFKQKLIMPGETYRAQVKNNWRMWGPRGLLTLHFFFEWGTSIIIAPLKAKKISITRGDIKEFEHHGVIDFFRRKAQEVAALNMYDRYTKSGWTPHLASQIRTHLAPTIVRTVALTWYAAAREAGVASNK